MFAENLKKTLMIAATSISLFLAYLSREIQKKIDCKEMWIEIKSKWIFMFVTTIKNIIHYNRFCF